MCEHCGCTEGSGYTLVNASDSHHHHEHPHGSDHPHTHSNDPMHVHTHSRISIETDILSRNDMLAQRNRGYFEAREMIALNLVSSPGSGKTTILERTLLELKGTKIFVIEGDQQTSLDADRIRAAGAPVIQVNTGNGCHLDAMMIHEAVKVLNPGNQSLLMIENVGNLVCPALFDLGENFRVVIISVTEGEDKPLKYPNMFQSAHLCIINKTDLIPHLDFNLEALKNYALRVNPKLQFIELSAKTGQGFEKWIDWLGEIRTT